MEKSDLNGSMLFKLRDGRLVVMFERRDTKSTDFYDKNYLNSKNSFSVTDVNKYYDKFLKNSSSSDHDVIAIKQMGSPNVVVYYVLSNIEPDSWDWQEDSEKQKLEKLIEEAQAKIAEAQEQLKKL